MKKTLIAIALVLVSVPALAQGHSNCKVAHLLATHIMDARQKGMAMPDVMEIVATDKAATELAKIAYDRPRWSTKEMQSKEVADFANDAFAACVKTVVN